MNEGSLSTELRNQNDHINQLAECSVRRWKKIEAEVCAGLEEFFGENGYHVEDPICSHDRISMNVVLLESAQFPSRTLSAELLLLELHSDSPDFAFSFAGCPPICFGPWIGWPIGAVTYSELNTAIRNAVSSQLRKILLSLFQPPAASKGTIHPERKIASVLQQVAELLKQG